MSSIIDTSTLYNTYSQNVKSSAASDLQSSLGNIGKDSSEEQLMSVCKSFESYFVQKIIEQAKSSVENEDDQGEYMKYFGDIMNEQYANAIADQDGTGLAQQLFDSMKSRYNL